MVKQFENTKIVNQKAMINNTDPTPHIIVYTDVKNFKKPGTIWNLYGKESIQAMKEVCEDALVDDEGKRLGKTLKIDESVPEGEFWMVNKEGKTVAKVVNVGSEVDIIPHSQPFRSASGQIL